MKRIALSDFWREATRAARLGATPRDRLILWVCQVAHTLRYRVPASVSTLRLEPSILCHGSVLHASIHFCQDDWLAFQQVFVEEEYRWDGATPRRILDAGANCGFASLWLASKFPHAELCSVEPHPTLARTLRRTLECNAVRSTVIEAALAPTDGQAALHLGALSTTHSLHADAPLGGIGTVKVDTVSMPTLLSQLGWEEVDLLKLDIEGGEAELLAGNPPWLRRVRAILGELHGDYGPEQLSADLRPTGFVIEVRRAVRPYLFTAIREMAG